MVPFLYVEFTFWLTLILSLHRSRDSTLRAGALTCSKMYDTWQASPLDNITISLYNIMSLNILLERNQELGELIRTFTAPNGFGQQRSQTQIDGTSKLAISFDTVIPNLPLIGIYFTFASVPELPITQFIAN